MGLSVSFATNYLGPFALTMLLLPSIKQKAGSRVVTVSSSASNQGKVRVSRQSARAERVYKPMNQAYAQSKLADLIFSQELQRRLKASGSPILSIAAHPGYAVTNLQADHVAAGLKILMATMRALSFRKTQRTGLCLRCMPRLLQRRWRAAIMGRMGSRS